MPGNRAAVLAAPGSVVLEDRPVPRPGPHEVLVQVRAVGVCGSDVHYYRHGRIGDFVVRSPIVLGHEAAGMVVALGEEVGTHAVGDRVAIEPGVPCGRCRQCRTGHYNLCPDVVFLATPPVDGAFTQYIAINENFAYQLPDSLSDQAGALMEPLSVGIWACRKARVQAGDRVLVTGAGPIGLMALQAARAFGATQVEVSDVNEHRLALATRLGAARALKAGQDVPGEADALIECSGQASALAAGISALRPAATAVVVGMSPSSTMDIPFALVQAREIWLTGTFRYANTYPTAIALAQSGAVDLEAMVTGHYALGEAERALRAGAEDPASVKVIVHPQDA